MPLLIAFIVVLSTLPAFFARQIFPGIPINLLFWSGLFFLSIHLSHSPRRFIRLTGWILPCLVFLFIFLSYGFFLFTGSYINYGIAAFALSNLVQLLLHFMQHAMNMSIYLILIWALSTALCLISIRRARHVRINPAYPLACLALSILFMLFKREDHPVTAFFWEDEGFIIEPNLEQLTPLATPPGGVAPVSTHPVIIIYLESWRHDLLDMEPSPAPRLKSVLHEGYLFKRSYAAATHSNYSNPAFWYSQYPLHSRHATVSRVDDPWPRKSAFTALKGFGYTTAYVSSQNERWGNMIAWMKAPGIDFFFHSEDYKGDTWENQDDMEGLALFIQKKIATSGKVEDSETLRIAWDWVDKHKTVPFALGVTLQNTHFNYYIPKGAPEPFQPSVLDFPTPYYVWPEERKVDVKNRYLNAVYNDDVLLGEFFDKLKAAGLWDNSCILVTGDGGEGFYEHDFGNHSGPAYDEAVRSATWIKPPKSLYDPKWSVVEKPVSHIDLMPSLFELLGLPVPPEFQGVGFRSSSRPEVYIHSNGLFTQNAVIRWPWKLMNTLRPAGKGYELYNLEEDPGELDNRYKAREETSQDLKACLNQWLSNQLYYYKTPEIYQKFYPPRYETNPAKPRQILPSGDSQSR